MISTILDENGNSSAVSTTVQARSACLEGNT